MMGDGRRPYLAQCEQSQEVDLNLAVDDVMCLNFLISVIVCEVKGLMNEKMTHE